MYSSVTMILMSLLIPELVHGSCQYIPQETLAIPGKKSKGHLRLQAFMLLRTFVYVTDTRKSLCFLMIEFFLWFFASFFYIIIHLLYFCSVIGLSLQGLHPGSLSAELPRREHLSGL